MSDGGLLPFDEALARLLGSATPLGGERVPVGHAAGRVLAEDVVAGTPMPAFDHSAMDGYAVAIADFAGAGPWTLPVEGESAAGGELPLFRRGAACRIFTGARLPDGADAVVMQEHVARDGDRATFAAPPAPGAHVRRRGADLAEGAVALARGTRLGPGQVALAAALDRAHLEVARRPVVAILASGDELRAPGDAARPGSVVESNAYFVAASARAAGADVRLEPFVRDEAAHARTAVERALRGCDVLVTIGGVSVGDRDVMRAALEGAGVTIDFWKVRIKPGKPLAVGRSGSGHVVGLPGNPASASLTFLLFGVPLLRALQGDARPTPPRIDVTLSLDAPLRRSPGRMEFARARLEPGGRAHVFANQASGAVTSFAEADALVIVPPEVAELVPGARHEAVRLSDI